MASPTEQKAAFDSFLVRATTLNLSKSSGPPKPYKPAMLLAAILWLHKSRPADNLIMLSELKPVFQQVMAAIAPTSTMPDTIALPFRHLESDGIWRLMAAADKEAELNRLFAMGAKAHRLVRAATGVRLDADVFGLLRDSTPHALTAAEAVWRHYLDLFAIYGADTAGAWRQLSTWLCGAAVGAGPGTSGLPEQTDAERQIQDSLVARWPNAPFALEAPRPALRSLTERVVEDHIVASWSQTPFGHLALAGRQVLTPLNTIDLLAHSPASRSWMVIELKRNDGDDRVIGQLARYRGWIAHDRAADDQARVTGAIVTDVVTARLQYSVKTQIGVELWRYDNALAFERVV